ncbi:hypothetical protein F5Y04DRAFT_245072 [Hypomontagnella monticulosa]|nr:hypothetical protein F5Y04DRAFT_245072 [Hypomontagnella monticulosa]
MSSRRVGLSRTQKPPRLLAKIRKEIEASSPWPYNVTSSVSVSTMGRSDKVKGPESVDAPPISSSDEDDLKNDYSRDSDGGSDGNERVDIKHSVFGNSQSSAQTRNTRNAREGNGPSSRATRAMGGSRNNKPSSSAGSKRSAEGSLPDMGSHLKDEYNWVKKPKKTATKTYSSQPSQPKSSQPRSSQKHGLKSSAAQRSTTPPPSKKSKHRRARPSPEGAPPSPTIQFINYGDSELDEPTEPTEAPVLRQFSPVPDDSPEKKLKTYCLYEVHRDKSDADVATGTGSSRPNRKERSKRPKIKTRRSSPEPVPEEFTQRPAFKTHSLDDLDYLDDSDDKVVALFENKVSDDELGDISVESPVATKAKCPMCHEMVDAELLAKYSDRGRMNIKQQTAFCRLHRRRTALDSRSQKGYPKINWTTLGTRLKKHQNFLRDILEGTQVSHYHEVLKENVDAGKNRTVLKTEDSLTPGYYGPRGLRAMSEHIMQTLSSVVRKRAVEDRVVSARGYTGYVQAVLVPELAVRLIMEDMDVTEEDARTIMRDSIEVGELLHEDAGDVIVGVSDDEEDVHL